MTTPGYVLPTSTVQPPRHLTLIQFIQTVLVGVSGLPGPLVRPNWQRDPPANPDIDVTWMGIELETSAPDANGYLGTNAAGVTTYQRQEQLEIACQIYGPDAFETAGLIRDGFQIPQNRYALTGAKMGFVEASTARHVPDLVNERFIDRWVMSVILRRQIQSVYAIPTLLSASGNIHTVLGTEEYLLAWETQTEET